MNLTRPSEVKALLDRLEIRPNRTLGQNFLIDANILRIILEAADVTPEDTVLEIGAGLGVLTSELVEQAARVIAVEKDPKLYAWLTERFVDAGNLEIIHDDALKLDCDALIARGVDKMISNLPYSVSSRIIFEWSISPTPLKTMVTTIQKEVADRLTSGPGTKDYGLLSVVAQLRYDIELVKEISPTCFLPAPEVRSAIVRMKLRSQPFEPADRKHLIALLKTGFGQRRKQVLKVLTKAVPPRQRDQLPEFLERLGIDAQARAENVSLEQWVSLSDLLTK